MGSRRSSAFSTDLAELDALADLPQPDAVRSTLRTLSTTAPNALTRPAAVHPSAETESPSFPAVGDPSIEPAVENEGLEAVPLRSDERTGRTGTRVLTRPARRAVALAEPISPTLRPDEQAPVDQFGSKPAKLLPPVLGTIAIEHSQGLAPLVVGTAGVRARPVSVHRTQVRLPEELLQWLTAQAANRSRTLATVVALAAREFADALSVEAPSADGIDVPRHVSFGLTIPVSLRFTPAQLGLVDDLATNRRVTRSAVVVAALRAAVAASPEG